MPLPSHSITHTADPPRIEVLVCHGNPVLQAGLMVTLARHADFHCTEADGSAPPHGLGAMPDVIVTDHHHGPRSVATTAKTAGPQARPRTLIVTDSDRECDIRAALSAGVQGYLLLEDAAEQLAAAVRAVRHGERILSPKVASRLAETVGQDALTSREEEVLGLVVEGLCNKSIADRLGITAGTVKSHLRSAFGKLGAESRTQAVAITQRRGLLQLQTAALPHDRFAPALERRSGTATSPPQPRRPIRCAKSPSIEAV